MSTDLARTGDKRMTVKEVAEGLGIPERTVHNAIDRALPGIKENGKTTYLSEQQVAIISAELKRAHNSDLASTGKVFATDIEMMEQGARFAAWAMGKLKEQEAALAEAAPKVEFFDQVASSKDAIPMREAAAALNLKGWGRNNLFAFLREKAVLDQNNVPYREYQDRGYFRVVETQWNDPAGETHITFKTLVYQKGLAFIRKMIAAQEAHA